MKERIQAWIKPRKKWLVPLLCLILGGLFGGSFNFQEDPEVEIYFDDSTAVVVPDE